MGSGSHLVNFPRGLAQDMEANLASSAAKHKHTLSNRTIPLSILLIEVYNS
jgi:hypothetical protein